MSRESITKVARKALQVFGLTTLASSVALISLGNTFLLTEINGYRISAWLVGGLFLLLLAAAALNGRNLVDSIKPRIRTQPKLLILLAALIAYIAYQLVRLVPVFDSPRDSQSIIIVSIWLIGGLYLAMLGRWTLDFGKVLVFSAVAGSILIIVFRIFGVEGFSSRHHSMFLIVPLVIALYAFDNELYRFSLMVIILLGIFFSESRMASAVAIFVVIGYHLLREGLTLGARIRGGFTGPALALIVALTDTDIYQRFFTEKGDQATVTLPGGVKLENLNTNGRIEVWTSLLRALEQNSIVWGSGLNSSNEFVNKNFGWTHPHNEFLKVFYDLGIVGLILFLLVLVMIMVQFGPVVPGRTDSATTSAFLALASVSLMGMTDLSFVAAGVMLPFTLWLSNLLSLSTQVSREKQ